FDFTGIEKLVGGSADDTFRFGVGGSLAAATGRTNVAGGAGNDTIVGPNSDVAWTVTAGNVGSTAFATFGGIELLQGGSGSDTFTLAPGNGAGTAGVAAGTFVIEFTGTLGKRDVPELTVTSSLTPPLNGAAPTAAIATTVGGTGALNEKQTLTLTGAAAGTFTLTFGIAA